MVLTCIARLPFPASPFLPLGSPHKYKLALLLRASESESKTDISRTLSFFRDLASLSLQAEQDLERGLGGKITPSGKNKPRVELDCSQHCLKGFLEELSACGRTDRHRDA